MSTPFYDLASVVVLPSGYKSGKIYAQKPLTTDGQLTFTRASTATRVNASGLIETVSSGVPRLDYTNSSCPKLLLEPQRTNIAQYSQSFDNGYWEKGSVATITANSVVSPDGTQNADTLTANGSGSLFARVNCYLGTAQTCSNSIFVKKANHRYVGLRNSGTTSQHDVFDFDTKTWTNNSGATLSYEEHANGWFRLKSTNTDAVNLNYYWSVIPALNTSGSETATVSNLSVYIWGAQAEQNAAYCTSYIPTTSAAVTRLADSLGTLNVATLCPTSNYSIFFEINNSNLGDPSSWLFLSSSSGSGDPFQIYSGTAIINTASGYVYPFSYSPTSNASGKVCLTYNGTTAKVFKDGVLVGQYTANANWANKTTLNFTHNVTQKNNIKQILLFSSVLTEAQAIELTTL